MYNGLSNCLGEAFHWHIIDVFCHKCEDLRHSRIVVDDAAAMLRREKVSDEVKTAC